MALVMSCFLVLFLVVDAFEVPVLVDPAPWINPGGVVAGSIGVSLLIADVLLPVPSSLVMVAHGAVFGVVFGTLLSMLGSVGAAVFGFAVGRRGGKLLDRVVTREERARADRLLARWGALAIVVTRPVPLLAETVAIMAGASSLGWGSVILASLAGSLPPALLYALAGAAAVSFQSTTLMFGVVLVIAGLFWIVGNRVEPLFNKRDDQSV